MSDKRSCVNSGRYRRCGICVVNDPTIGSFEPDTCECYEPDTIPQWMLEKHAEIYQDQITRMALEHTSGVETSQDIRGSLTIADAWLDSVLKRVSND